MKLSHNPEKMTNPGPKRIIRFYDPQGFMVADALAHDAETPGHRGVLIVDPANPLRRKNLNPDRCVDLQQQIVEAGELVYSFPSLESIRRHRKDQLAHLHESYKRLRRPHEYKVGLTETLWREKESMISLVREASHEVLDQRDP
jgi:nicotinate phosphoribosyltransferase